jgi:hypothetical protein
MFISNNNSHCVTDHTINYLSEEFVSQPTISFMFTLKPDTFGLESLYRELDGASPKLAAKKVKAQLLAAIRRSETSAARGHEPQESPSPSAVTDSPAHTPTESPQKTQESKAAKANASSVLAFL